MVHALSVLPPRRERAKKAPQPKVKDNLSVYGPIALFQRVEEIADAEGRSTSELVVGILEQWVAAYDAERRKSKA